MKSINITIFLLFFFQYFSFAQNDSIQARIVLIGDAGSLKNGRHPVVDAVRNTIKFDSLTTILFLGDNLYPLGLPDDSYPNYIKQKSILDSQIVIAKNTPTKVYFIPGNHDWQHEKPGGYAAIVREQKYVDNSGVNNVKFYPEDGCPGPVEISLSNDVTLVIMDSQWWLHTYDKPGIESDCPYKTKEEVLSQLDNIFSRNSKKLVLFACHHPFKSYGIHGGYFTIKQHIFPLTDFRPNLYIPLPVIGSIYPITRGIFGTAQDLHHPDYQNMITDIQNVAKKYTNIIFLSGHEHNLQYIKDSSYNYIITGSGTEKTRVSKNKKELYGAEENGFATLEISKNKNVHLTFYTVNDDSVKTAYNNNSILNFSKLPEEKKDTSKAVVTVPFKDSVVVAISNNYNNASQFKRFFLGDNYRKEWATPVHLKVFNLSKENGGYEIKSFSGGKETKSLRLQDTTGKEWTLRSVNKDPEGAIPENLRGSFAQRIVNDMISAEFPYAALTIPTLAKAADIIVASPKFYYIPNDAAFGIYQKIFDSTICLLEAREPTPDETDTKSTPKIINKLYDNNDNRIDEQEVLRARLLDILVGDWDRHFDQWKWGTRDTGEGKAYYAIPRDRDQAFFYSDGLLIKIVTMQLLPFLKGFRDDIPKINWFNWEARDFDRVFLNQLDKQKWKATIDSFQQNITDSVITTAVKKMPPEIYAIDGKIIEKKLINRRNILEKEGLDYYNFLSKTVSIVGSNDKEHFKVTGKGNDSLQVKVFKRKYSNDSAALMYSRVFVPRETKEIRLYGLNDNDIFSIDSSARSKIKVRMIGGKGDDTFNINGRVRNYIYDLKSNKNYVVNRSHSKINFSSDPHINDYTATGFKYNIYRFPQLNIGYNVDDKLLVGFGFLSRTYGFRKEPFATEQKFSALYAANDGAYQLNYQAIFNEALGKNDILINAEMYNPVLNNFFGLGDNTKIDPSKNLDYYSVRYKYAQGELLFRKRFNNVLSVMAGPEIYHYWNSEEDNQNRILEKPSVIGLDSTNIYSPKTYAGGKVSILINNLDNVLLPTRGINWNTEFTSLGGLTNSSKPFTSITSNMAVHAALSDPAKLVAVLRLGGGKILSKNYEYFQTLNLGANNFLRGFRKDRFSGTSLAYGSLELRIKLFESKSYIFPGDVGVVTFNDIGRVWLRGEDSKKWHDSYGGGIYYAAYNFALISATIGYSKEEQVFNFSIGTKFNITF
ncbi:MAG: BamA/TamA family outer membrane protein [Chitinophagaceae bacterium]